MKNIYIKKKKVIDDAKKIHLKTVKKSSTKKNLFEEFYLLGYNAV
jgi:hypothetical protein